MNAPRIVRNKAEFTAETQRRREKTRKSKPESAEEAESAEGVLIAAIGKRFEDRLLTRAAQNGAWELVNSLQSRDREGAVRREARINDRTHPAMRPSAHSASSALSGFDFLAFPLRLRVSAVNSIFGATLRRQARISDRGFLAMRPSALSASSALSGFDFLAFPLRLSVSAVNSSKSWCIQMVNL
jgi:hypothetical protein